MHPTASNIRKNENLDMDQYIVRTVQPEKIVHTKNTKTEYTIQE